MSYRAVRRIVSPYCIASENATLPANVPATMIKRWLADGVIARGKGDKVVDFIEDTGRIDEEDLEFDEENDLDVEDPDFQPDDVEDDEEDAPEAPVKPKAAPRRASKPKPGRKAE